VLLRIVETNATPAELLEAFTWTTADDQIGTDWNTGRAAPSPGSMKSSNATNRNHEIDALVDRYWSVDLSQCPSRIDSA
jgi:hypothetical protein